jgi:hypothetical protein
MRIAWVHPSWRDLVIERLAADPVARREFLGACGIEGALLALSVGGGHAGERALPLLRGDDDWDALADSLHELLREADDPGLVRLLAALGAAADAELDGARRNELEALARSCLEQVRGRWDDGHRPLALTPLEAWFDAAGRLRDPPRPPQVAPTWIELLPGGDLADPLEAARAADWLGLTELLAQHAPDKLRALGFPERQRERIAALVTEAAQRMWVTEDNAALRAILARAARLVPDLTVSVDAPAPPLPTSAELPEPSEATAAFEEQMLVDRVLRDL